MRKGVDQAIRRTLFNSAFETTTPICLRGLRIEPVKGMRGGHGPRVTWRRHTKASTHWWSGSMKSLSARRVGSDFNMLPLTTLRQDFLTLDSVVISWHAYANHDSVAEKI